jgi:cytochrome c-type biogenesis protein
MSLDLLGIFGAGLLTFVTPCVLPLIPIYLSALVGSDIRSLNKAGRGQLLVRSGLFSVGFVLVFTVLGFAASSLGAFLADNKASLQAVGALLILLFGLKFLGVIEIPWIEKTIRADNRKLTTRFGGINAFLMGLVFAAGWSPCIGPILGSVLTYTASSTSSPLSGALYLTTYGLGFAVPLLGLAVFAEIGLKALQKIGRHMQNIEFGLGSCLVVVAGTMTLDVLPAPPLPTEESCQAFLNKQKPEPAMLAFTSPDCPICSRMKPIVNALIHQCDGNKVRVRQVDVSLPDNRQLALNYHLRGVPTFIFVDENKQEVARLVGEQTEATLIQALSTLKGAPCDGVTFIDPSFDGPEKEPKAFTDPATCSGGLRDPKDDSSCKETY